MLKAWHPLVSHTEGALSPNSYHLHHQQSKITNSPSPHLRSLRYIFWILSVEAWGPHSVSSDSNADLFERSYRPELYLILHLCSLYL